MVDVVGVAGGCDVWVILAARRFCSLHFVGVDHRVDDGGGGGVWLCIAHARRPSGSVRDIGIGGVVVECNGGGLRKGGMCSRGSGKVKQLF